MTDNESSILHRFCSANSAADDPDLMSFEIDGRGILRSLGGGVPSRLGLDPAKLIGTDIADLGGNFPAAPAELREAMLSGGGHYVSRCGGMTLDFLLTRRLGKVGGSDGVAGLAVDVSRTAAMAGYGVLPSEFSDMTELIHEVLWKTDREGRITYVSRSAAQLYGYREEELVGKKRRCDLSLNGGDSGREFWADTIRRGAVLENFENVLRKKNGEVRYVRTSGKPVRRPDGSLCGYLGVDIDITEQKLVERSLRKKEDTFEQAQSIAKIGSWELDHRTGQLTGSQEAHRIFAHPMDSKLSLRDFFRSVHPEERSRIQRAFSDSVKDHAPYDREYRVVSCDGVTKVVRVLASTRYDPDTGAPETSLGTVQDVTESRGIQNELIEAKKNAEKANRAKSDFLANMSHEIRTPMNGIIGFLDLMKQTELSEEQQNLVKGATVASETLLHLIGDILDISKIEAGKMTLTSREFHIRPLIRDSVRIFAPQMEQKGLEYQITVSDEVPSALVGDPARLMQIFNNLLSNAVKFTQEGCITVRARVESRSREETALRVAVHDTGIGIGREVVKKLFAPFTQGDSSETRKYGGTGLGLAITKRLVGMMGGGIFCKSSPGKGATFIFVVRLKNSLGPPETRECGGPAGGGAPPRQSGGEMPRILVADDNDMNLLLITKMLEKNNIRCVTAKNGREAVEAVKAASYDAVLMDCQMPELDGIAATAQIRSLSGERGNIPIIALTANVMNDEQAQCLSAGMNDYISKPVRMDVLLAKIGRFLP